MIFIYTYLFKYDHEDDIYQLPIPPEEMVTIIENNNKIYETIGSGEINILKNIGLRILKLQVILPNDLSLPFIQSQYASSCILDKPIVYLNKFRQFKSNKKPFRFMITRILPNSEEIFEANMLVTLEEYSVFEKAGEEGDFLVNIILREYRETEIKELISNDDGTFTSNIKRNQKETPSSYTVKDGDTLWAIAKRELNNELLHKEIAAINNITDPKNLQIGTVLILP